MPFFGPFIRHKSARHHAHIERDATGALADAISSAGMAGPASVALRILRPVSWIGGQLLWVMEPLLGTLGMRRTQGLFSLPGLASLLEREDSVDDLISRLDGAHNERRI